MEFVVGDIRDGAVVEWALEGIDGVVHLAAAVGAGQSMYEVERYSSVNNLGTAVLLDRLVRKRVERLVVASSKVVYAEGLYRDRAGAAREVPSRSEEQLRRSEWEPRASGHELTPMPTPETMNVKLESVYALSKYDQERMCLVLGRSYGVPTVILRLFNVYGPRQSLEGPHAGVVAAFASRLVAGRPPLVHEDGEQRRDFVSVHDVARAFCLALESDAAPGAVFNIGSGETSTVGHVARRMVELARRPDLMPEVTGKHRVGDVRHCFADVRRAESVLGFRASMELDAGLGELVRWLEVRESGPGLRAPRSESETDIRSDARARGLAS